MPFIDPCPHLQERWVFGLGELEFDTRGNPLRMIGTIQDITGRKQTEESLRVSQERFDSFMRYLPGFAYLKDHDRRILFVNDRFETDFGIPRADWLGKTNEEIWPGEIGDKIRRDDEIVLSSGRPYVTVEDVPTRGELRSYRTVKFPIPRADGLSWLGGVSVDITELKRADAALRASEAFLDAVIEHSPHAMWISDEKGTLIRMNQACRSMLRVTDEELVGKYNVLEDNIVEEQGAMPLVRQVFEHGESVRFTLQYDSSQLRQPNLRETAQLMLETTISPVLDAEKRVAHAIIQHLDITERERGARALLESEERFRLLVQNSNDIVTVLNEEGIMTSVSGPLERIFGYKPEELIGRSVFELTHPDNQETEMKKFREIMTQPGPARRVEYRFRHKNGNWIPLEAIGNNLLHDPVMKGIVLNVRDISERNKLQEQLQQAMKMEAVGRLAGGIAHDFNNILTAIIGNIDLARMDLAHTDPLVQYLGEARKAAESAASLTRELLAFSRRQIIEPRVLNLNDLIGNLKNMLTRLVGEDIALQTILGEELGSVRVDPGQFEQVLVNLVVNARDAMQDGGQLLIETANIGLDDYYCAHHPQVQPGNFVLLALSDTGHGMSEEVKTHLFEPFFTTKPKGRGTGLGLATIFGTVKQAGGDIMVYSEIGQGTTVKIYLPRIEEQAEKLVKEKPDLDFARGNETILLVEDEASVRDLALITLKRLDIRCCAHRMEAKPFCWRKNIAGALIS